MPSGRQATQALAQLRRLQIRNPHRPVGHPRARVFGPARLADITSTCDFAVVFTRNPKHLSASLKTEAEGPAALWAEDSGPHSGGTRSLWCSAPVR